MKQLIFILAAAALATDVLAVNAIVVTPAQGTVTKLSTFTFQVEDGAVMCPSCQDGIDILLKDAQGNVLVTIDSDKLSRGIMFDNDWNTIGCKVTFSAISADGTYTLYVPAGVFYVGDNMDNNAEATFTYTIGEGSSLDAVVTESESTLLYNFNGQRVQSGKGLVIVNGKKTVNE